MYTKVTIFPTRSPSRSYTPSTSRKLWRRSVITFHPAADGILVMPLWTKEFCIFTHFSIKWFWDLTKQVLQDATVLNELTYHIGYTEYRHANGRTNKIICRYSSALPILRDKGAYYQVLPSWKLWIDFSFSSFSHGNISRINVNVWHGFWRLSWGELIFVHAHGSANAKRPLQIACFSVL